MANEKEHDHTVGDADGLVQYRRTGDGVEHDTGVKVPRDTLATSPQQYIDHAGRTTTVKEYKSGRVDVMVGQDQPRYWAKEKIATEAQQLAGSTNWKATGDRFRALLDEWKAVGAIDEAVDQSLWLQFDGARKTFLDARQRHFDELKRGWEGAAAELTRIANRAEALADSNDLRSAGDEMKRLFDEWKRAGHCEKGEEAVLWNRFSSARGRLNERRAREFEKRKAEWASNKWAKERAIMQAEAIANSSDLKAAGGKMRALMDDWKKIGPCEKSDNDRLWDKFKSASDKLRQRKQHEFDQRKADWAKNKSAKERLVVQASSLARSSDLKAASDTMRSLTDQWRKIGPCEKLDNDRLWEKFSAAGTALRDAKNKQFESRKKEWESNKNAKDRLVTRMSALSTSSDFRAAKDEARSLSDQWRAIGPCDKADNDRLWSSFKAAKDRLFEAAKREAEQRALDRRRRAWEQVSRLEAQLSNTESAIYRAHESYNRAMAARSPSFNNPNLGRILSSQQERRSAAWAKIGSLENRKWEIAAKLNAARSRAAGLS